MRVVVTQGALAPQPEEGHIRILHFDLLAIHGCNPFGNVAFFAFLQAVLAFQDKTGLSPVVKDFFIQWDEREFRSKMLFVTAGTIEFPGGVFICPGVKT